MKPLRARAGVRVDTGSPASDGGRGLKLGRDDELSLVVRFARQRWRAWIETSVILNRLGLSHSVRPPAMAGVD